MKKGYRRRMDKLVLENSGEVLASLIEAKSAFDNLLDGVVNKQEEVRKPSVEDDPLDIASSQGEDNKMDSDDEVLTELMEGLDEESHEGKTSRLKSPVKKSHRKKSHRKESLMEKIP